MQLLFSIVWLFVQDLSLQASQRFFYLLHLEVFWLLLVLRSLLGP